jgi:general secretion pathway protein J
MRARGFSLLEVLVAVAIFAVLAALAYGGLDAVARSRAQVDEASARLAALQSAVGGLERALRDALPRPARGAGGEVLPALTGGPASLEFTHAAFASPATEASAQLGRSGWLLDAGALRRVRWPVVDRASSTPPSTGAVLDDLVRLRLRYLDREARWRDSWPPRDGPQADVAALPAVVEFTLVGDDFGEIVRRVALVDPVDGEPAP